MATERTSRRQFLKALSLGAASLAVPGSLRAASPAGKPNIVLILVDDMGWTDVACFGSKYYQTPHVDRLCSQGMKFTNGYAACAVCSPTRAAVQTGRYPARLGITDWIRARFQGGAIPSDKKNPTDYVGGPNNKVLCPPNPFWMELEEVTLAEVLKPAGYVCCHIGKWHLGADDWYPDRQGYDLNIGGCDYGQPPGYFDPYRNAKLKGIPTLSPRKEGEYLTDREGDEAAKFIRDNAGRPFFLNLCHYAVHTPLQAKKDLIETYKARTPTRQKNPTYAAMVHSVDDSTGKVLAALEECGVADNTIVIFTSDNGGLLGSTDNAPLRAGKGFPYEGGIRVPLIIRWPRVVKAGSVSDEPALSVDFLPTFCAAAGAALPAGREIDGVSLLPVLRGEGSLGRKAIFWHYPHYRGSIVPYSIVRAGDWKLIKQYDGREFELYNLKDDLSETSDLSEKMPEKVRELDATLTAHLKAVGARMPRPNPAYAPGAQSGKKGKKAKP